MEAWKTVIQVKLAWLWIKKNWKAAALVVWSLFVWLISKRNSQGVIDAMNANKESYEAQIRSLKKQHSKEIQKREDLRLKYEETLARIEEKYKKKKDQLTKVEKKKVKQIVEKAKDDPNEINNKIEDLFGFTSDS